MTPRAGTPQRASTAAHEKESEPRKRFIADAIADSGVQAVVNTADRSNDELGARAACLNALVEDAAAFGCAPRVDVDEGDSDDAVRRLWAN